ncbi:YD repeat-containing protein [Pseudomonas cuatrocienegasensis]|uniref:YD repeat-containing protein n=1 Tax=Pseudomonas cuatrocienegasensis TaxID=543360 RepID=A0ABY1B3E5_9PSED|nr:MULTISPECIES: DUF6531 domain-containing protein [Pseudomonas]SEP84029.1 YD repeat-containing protein [Pseudomonas cuatrocienegasensis]
MLIDFKKIEQGSIAFFFAILFPSFSLGCEMVEVTPIDTSLSLPPPPSPSMPAPDNNYGPQPCGLVGNPISIFNGSKIQVEVDLPYQSDGTLSLYRTYNSLDGGWRHNYSSALYVGDSFITFEKENGERYVFIKKTLTAYSGAKGRLTRSGTNWLYQSGEGELYLFSKDGVLMAYTDVFGRKVSLVHQAAVNSPSGVSSIVITNAVGKKMTLTQDVFRQLRSAAIGGTLISYEYSKNNLVSVAKHGAVRRYAYEDARFPWLLTGLIDENGKRYATWKYDERLRAVSSEHNGGADLTSVEYVDSKTTVVTNPLGKKTKYVHDVFNGGYKIVQIIGEPSPNCPYSNSKYAYNASGDLVESVDGRGLKTTYVYNNKSQLTLKTEAHGTSLSRATKYEWHATLPKIVKIITQSNITNYFYTNNGQLKSLEIVQAQ